MPEPHVLENRKALERAIHVERSALAQDLAGLSEAQGAQASLCERWTVEEVVAHLTAGASTGMWRWLLSMLAARFDPDLHNDRRLAKHRGATPEETLRRFREVVAGPAGPTGHTAAWLGEIVVHSEDIRRPLGLVRTPPVTTTTAVAEFFTSRDFTVASKTAIAGLRIEATDGPFTTGSGDLLRGRPSRWSWGWQAAQRPAKTLRGTVRQSCAPACTQAEELPSRDVKPSA